jgi:hypothetical protein
MFYERTGKCPYRDICEHYQRMLQVKNQLIEYSRDAAVNRNTVDSDSYARIMDENQNKLDDLSRAMVKCLENNGRCLRYWQFVNAHTLTEATSPSVQASQPT